MKLERPQHLRELLRRTHEYLQPLEKYPGREDSSLLRKSDCLDSLLNRDLAVGTAREASLAGAFVNGFPRNPKAHPTLDNTVS